MKRVIFVLIAILCGSIVCFGSEVVNSKYPLEVFEYGDQSGLGLVELLWARIVRDPFNLFATIIFGLAILHTFFYGYFINLSRKYEELHRLKMKRLKAEGKRVARDVSFRATIFHFFGEIEVVFGIWLVPLLVGFAVYHGWDAMVGYLDKLTFVEKKYVEPMFVIVIMAIAATKPIIYESGKLINRVASLGGGRPSDWWISILFIGSILGSFITEPAAITISALLLSKKFYIYTPSFRLRYATLGLLLVSISVGGTLTHFAAPPVLMVASKWGWGFWFMFLNFGIKAIVGIILSIGIYYLILRKDLRDLDRKAKLEKFEDEKEEVIPFRVCLVHIFFLVFTVITLHHPPLFLLGFLFFIGYVTATRRYQYTFSMKTPILVGFFLAGLVTHGSLQAWWIEPVLSRMGEFPLFLGSIVLTAFNDNAAITYLASLVPDFTDVMKYLVVGGAVTGGGLTVIANAPNPAGLSILKGHFRRGVSPLHLFLGALVPTLIVGSVFYLIW